MEKQRCEESRRRRKEMRTSEKRKREKKEDAGAWKGRWFVAPEGRKVTSPKRRVRSQLARWEMQNCAPLWREAHLEVKMSKHFSFGTLLEVAMSKKCTPLWREAHFQVKMYKAHHSRTTFGSCDVQKVHDVVAQSTFPSQNVQDTSPSEHSQKSQRCTLTNELTTYLPN